MDSPKPTTPAGVAHEVEIEHLKTQQGENVDNIKELFRGQTKIREDLSAIKENVKSFEKHVNECSDEKRLLRRWIIGIGSVIAAGTGVSGHDEALGLFDLVKQLVGIT